MSVFAPTGELLFFVWAKKSNQKKAHPTAACFLRAKAFTGGWQKGLPVPLPTCRIHAATAYSDMGRAIPSKCFGARRGRRGKSCLLLKSVLKLLAFHLIPFVLSLSKDERLYFS